ncbi:unnamed protein product [Clonostachys rhizophaga]|uniref:Uncharacterized protein n=2 Tax=Clonostachys TaxID=110564 RepID=A0A9N9YCW5_9HYPO|nr:unnamed protein product [Clonostachys rhizophaga]CAH0043962.1 unnamed protein product [Clonostachys solani]
MYPSAGQPATENTTASNDQLHDQVNRSHTLKPTGARASEELGEENENSRRRKKRERSSAITSPLEGPFNIAKRSKKSRPNQPVSIHLDKTTALPRNF